MTRPHLSALIEDVDSLDLYPLANDERLTAHYFITFHFDRWLNSELRLTAPPDVRGLALDLYFLAQRQSPVGTLPDDDRQLAALLMLDVPTWTGYRNRDPSPLYKWHRCLCGDQVRLMHPVVTEVVMDALGRRKARAEAAERGAEAKRVARVREALRAMGSRQAAENDAYVEWIDRWLVDNMPGNRRRTQDWYERALVAHARAEQRGDV